MCRVAALVFLASASVTGPASIAAGYPDHPIRLIVATAPGGAQSAVARALARELEEQLGQNIIVDNRGGANGIIGYEIVAKALPDGYTVLHAAAAFAITASVYTKLPFSVERDFLPITDVCAGQGALLVVNPSVPARSVKELIALARSSRLTFSSPGVGNVLHVIAEAFNVSAGTQMTHVPYKGAGPALLAVIGGEVQVMFSSVPIAVPHIKTGKLRALGYSGATRLDALPELPTVAEAGLTGFKLDSGGHAWIAPAKTPNHVALKLHAEIRTALDKPRLRDFLLANGFVPGGSPPAEFRKTFQADIKRWGAVVRQAKIEQQ